MKKLHFNVATVCEMWLPYYSRPQPQLLQQDDLFLAFDVAMDTPYQEAPLSSGVAL